jgi:AAA15 family ATPase/GTPase
MIKQFAVQNFKALKNIDIELASMTAFIGENGSGKSTILEALSLVLRFTSGQNTTAEFLQDIKAYSITNCHHGNTKVPTVFRISTHEFSECSYEIEIQRQNLGENNSISAKECLSLGIKNRVGPFERELLPRNHGDKSMIYSPNKFAGTAERKFSTDLNQSSKMLGIYKLKFSSLCKPVAPSVSNLENDGFGLPWLLEKIKYEDDEKFLEMQNKFCEKFPQFKKVQLFKTMSFSAIHEKTANTEHGVGINFILQSGVSIPASQVSEGTLIWLTLLGLFYSSLQPSVILLEEPEAGLHPKSQVEIIHLLRAFSENTQCQIVFTTHSPYLLDALKPEEVYVTKINTDGSTLLGKMSDNADVAKQLGTFNLGEIWSMLGENKLMEKEEQ